MNRDQRRAARRGENPNAVDERRQQQQQQQPVQPGLPQDVTSTRAKNQRHGKVTADKWNQ